MPIPKDTPSVDRSLLRDDVYLRLRDAIVDGTFKPGEQLRDSDLAAWIGVSRTPVREALLKLADSGLVVTQPGRSTIVSTIETQALSDARDVVAAMHELAVCETIGKLTEVHIDRMRSANSRFQKALEAGDAIAALKADDELHAVPVRASGNQALQAVLDRFGPVVRRAELLRFRSSDGQASLERHTKLIELCASGKAEDARRLAFDMWKSLPSSIDSVAQPQSG
ncbi:GntR family transcriptional regulator [Arthrobacter zhaoguopingii]|uniref:GntR family transcriptional regulator n=1 Tax=Arthrobacter zhaoguopingii TaxID=2681491 RepID=UPI00135B2D5F|nr:GntR family transcriptional regulator [Arthrobacter zhaoguopingii]